MLLVRGGPGSGKTAWILRNFKELCGSGDRSGDRRIVVPTATLVRHLQHELARDGVVFSPSSVISLSRFAQERAPEIRLIPAGLMQVIVRDALKRLNLAVFAGVADTDGMVATVIETIALFENADCTPDVLASRKPKGGAKAFELLWRAVDEAVAAAGYSSRAGLIRAAARNTEPAVVWMDGFLNLSPLESSLVRSLARHCDLTMAITNSRAAEEIHRLCLSLNAREVLLSGNARKPVREIFEARSPEREVDEIARRILDLSAQGVPFRRVAVALRDPSTYLPLVSAAFERFGIPSRSYFSTALRTHPAAVFLNGLVSGALEGWDFETTLQTLRAQPRWGRSADFDRFDFAVREAMPGRGSAGLLALCESEWLREEISGCLKTETWIGELQTPSGWGRRLERLAAGLYRPGRLEDPADYAAVEVARSHVAGLRAWIQAIDSAVGFWRDSAAVISLEEFWPVAVSAIETASFQTPDDRSNVVHVMSAHEARQWDVAALFVCGLIDRDFPKRHPQNLLFSDREISGLKLPLRKASDQEADEEALFESLRSRASRTLVLSYPGRDASGKGAQRSRFLEPDVAVASAVRCKPVGEVVALRAAVAGRVTSAELLAEMAGLHRKISMTALEDLAQCRFKFFGSRSLGLKPPPESPAERLNPRVTGSILHEALEAWLADRSVSFVDVFEQTFDETCRRDHIPASYRLEVDRIAYREIARKISASKRWESDESLPEVELALEFPGGIAVSGRVDRIDRFGNECVIIDYKASKTASVEKRVESKTRLQAPLYALAVREGLGLIPVGVLFWAVREDKLFGWGRIPGTEMKFRDMPASWAVEARDRTVERLAEFLAGAVHAHPVDTEQCRWCDFAAACRVEQRKLIVIGEGSAAGG